jgi:hypothetical protein
VAVAVRVAVPEVGLCGQGRAGGDDGKKRPGWNAESEGKKKFSIPSKKKINFVMRICNKYFTFAADVIIV